LDKNPCLIILPTIDIDALKSLDASVLASNYKEKDSAHVSNILWLVAECWIRKEI
jgi:hypothetical protein